MKIFPAITFILLTVISTSAISTDLDGTVTHVRDGDTIEVSNIPIRLTGVSAPELNKPLGIASKKFMRDLVLGKPIHCELNMTKTYDRLVGICYIGGEDIGASIIKAGLALDCPRYSGGLYAGIEIASGRDRIKLPRYCRK